MSRTVDTNILVYATHTASPFHDRARALVEHLVAGPGLAYVLWPAILGYVRIVTHPNILASPLSSDEAMSNVEALIAPSHSSNSRILPVRHRGGGESSSPFEATCTGGPRRLRNVHG
jgi:predicted nucleic acid-binding protein